jgi:starch synthase
MRVLMAASEAEPFVKTGGLGDVMGALPKAIDKKGVDVRVILPKYECIPTKFKQQMEFIGHTNVHLNWRVQYCGIFKLVYCNVTYYFIDNEYYFSGSNVYGDYDLERFTFFSKAVLEVLPIIDFFPDIIHCHDWQTGIIPVLLEAQFKWDERYMPIKTVFTIHNLKYQGIHGIDFVNDLLSLPKYYYSNDKIGKFDTANFMKAGIVFSNFITTVSPSYANEIKQPEFGEGLDWLIGSKSHYLGGIINGIDYDIYSPSKSKFIEHKYDYKNFSANKTKNKLELQQQLGLPQNEDIPLIAMVSRLTSQKGLDLISSGMNALMGMDIQLVVLGTGDQYYENMFLHNAWLYSNKLSANITFSDNLAHKIYAGADIFLMPSQYEPCGLGQLIAMAFGAIPIVHEVGGLKDTVIPYNEFTQEGNGFSFKPFSTEDMIYTIKRAVEFYHDKKVWNNLVKTAMRCDFSWSVSASHYINIYRMIKEW